MSSKPEKPFRPFLARWGKVESSVIDCLDVKRLLVVWGVSVCLMSTPGLAIIAVQLGIPGLSGSARALLDNERAILMFLLGPFGLLGVSVFWLFMISPLNVRFDGPTRIGPSEVRVEQYQFKSFLAGHLIYLRGNGRLWIIAPFSSGELLGPIVLGIAGGRHQAEELKAKVLAFEQRLIAEGAIKADLGIVAICAGLPMAYCVSVYGAAVMSLL